MLTHKEKQSFRSGLFRHLDGIVVAPVSYSLLKHNVTKYLIDAQETSITEIAKDCNANEGYLNVALRVLASQGWLQYKTQRDNVTIKINDASKIAFDHFYLYQEAVELLKYSGQFHPRKFELEPFQKLEKLFIAYKNRFGIESSKDPLISKIQEQILKHIEGILVGPTTVHLGMGGMFHKYFMEASFSADEYHRFPESFNTILSFLSDLGWFEKSKNHYTFTNKGLFFAKRASAYGVTVSYIPMFRQMDHLLFGDPNVLWKSDNGDETHVDREMNVWGSGGAHAAYFKKIDEIIISLFNKPLDEQPKGILDMGCGNGAFLIHLFEVIESKTLRGQHLDDHPLFLVGADYNKAALKVTRANLIQADIWAKVVWGDISDPDLLEKDLNQNYNIALKDLLSVRTFLDHNRIWSTPESKLNANSISSGAFSYRGKRLLNNEVECNLKDHFKKWAPHITKYGLIVIELHTIAPELTANNIGKTAATAYDATHGFSDQYILEIQSFQKVVQEVGLKSDPNYFSKFPDSELATVSIHYLIGK